ncbi:hypothetical protein OG329_38910 [Streptomyces sp. NBC_01506]
MPRPPRQAELGDFLRKVANHAEIDTRPPKNPRVQLHFTACCRRYSGAGD